MHPTGWDTVIFTTAHPLRVVAEFLAAMAGWWPSAHGEVHTKSDRQVVSHLDFPEEKLPANLEVVLVFRDRAMNEHCEENGYVPMSDGDGPVALWARERPEVAFKIGRLAEVRAGDRLLEVAPYPAWLISPSVYELTVVTPADPEEHAFSASVLQVVVEACLKRERNPDAVGR
jgi:hypothetical protein